MKITIDFAIVKAAIDLYDNRLGWSNGRNPYAPPEFWERLGVALGRIDHPEEKEEMNVKNPLSEKENLDKMYRELQQEHPLSEIEKIEVGDEVIYKGGTIKGIVTRKEDTGEIWYSPEDGGKDVWGYNHELKITKKAPVEKLYGCHNQKCTERAEETGYSTLAANLTNIFHGGKEATCVRCDTQYRLVGDDNQSILMEKAPKEKAEECEACKLLKTWQTHEAAKTPRYLFIAETFTHLLKQDCIKNGCGRRGEK